MRSLTLATVFAAASGYVVMFLAARELGAASYERFAVYWALFFALAGVLGGIMQETTRAVATGPASTGSRGRRAEPATPADPARDATAVPIRLGPVLGVGAATLVLAAGPWWAPALLSAHRYLGILVMVVGVLGFAVHATVAGTLSGTERWGAYALLLTADAALRLVVAVVSLAVGAGTAGFMVTTVAGTVAWALVLAASPEARASLRAPTAQPPRAFVRGALTAAGASAATQVLIVGFPVLLKQASDGTDPAVLGALILAVTLTRAPLLVPLTSFQTAIIVYFLERRHAGTRALLVPFAAVTAVGAVGAGAAAAIGPWLLHMIFGATFAMSGPALAGLTAGAAATALLMVAGSAVLAHEMHTSYAGAWWLATGTTFGILLSGGDLVTATIAALLLGPLAGVGLAVAAIARRREGTPPAGEAA